MKHKLGIMFTVLLTMSILFACNSKEAPRTPVKGSETVTLTSQGEAYNQSFKLDLTQASHRYTLSSLSNKSFHSCVSCNQCGIQEIDGEKAYRVHNTTHGGFQVHLTTPMKASAIKSMKITYMSDVNATESAVRIYRSDDTDLGTIQNDTVLLIGAQNNWRTTYTKLDFVNVADEDGYVRSFQLVMRNKNNATFYIREMTITVDPQSLCDVEITAPVKWEKGAVTAIAEKIQKHFTDINCQATITVSCDTYLQNSTKYDGAITYKAKVELSGKTLEYQSQEKVIPRIEGQWLANEGLPYGASQDTDTSWEKQFLQSGILTLSNRKIACEEGLEKIEYAVVPQGTDYKSEDVQWHDLQREKLNKKGIKHTFLNAYLDYGTALVDGTAYTLYVRAVTNSENYILHIFKDFTYECYSQEIAQALPAAMEKIADKSLWLSQGKSAKDVLASAIGNKQIVIHLEEQKGHSSSTYQVGLTYIDDKFKDYTGEAFTLDNVVIWNSQKIAQSAILPTIPIDGSKDVTLASDPILQYANASYEEILRNDFESFKYAEICTPPPVQFIWAGPEGTYTLRLSKESSMVNARTYETTQNELYIYNLETGTTYYWQVESEGKTSPMATFTTRNSPRYVMIKGVCNMRDLGGYTTIDGKRIKQGLIYRSASFDSITKKGKLQLLEDLQLKTDLDFRGDNDARQPLGKDVQYCQIPITWYGGIFFEDKAALIGDVFKVFAKKENYPIGYHCQIGRDRTGTVSFLLLGLLGVDEETAVREFLMTFHSATGGYSTGTYDTLYREITQMREGLSKYAKEGASFQKQVEGYLLEAGVTQAEIKAIRNILLEN